MGIKFDDFMDDNLPEGPAVNVGTEIDPPLLEDKPVRALSLELLKEGKVLSTEFYGYNEIRDFLESLGYKDLGWKNSGITVPVGITFIEQYSNRSGSTCLYVSHDTKKMYSVDMGD
jgi:hypothetical protein